MKAPRQASVCEWAKVKAEPPRPGTKVGIALATIGRIPINGLRIAPTEGTNGWYLWCGEEQSQDPDFYQSMHVEHLAEYLPEVVEYLDLPPGYRFLIDKQDYEDVWFQADLLDT